ncbi:hypothetical protein HZI73_26375 (plasmid) [Vallitalea pronyensis]|uniref:Uncharacterized protein n=1 Tax=Vallitalea pronyensis TaxID=1348613 RepID=A0A8J8MQU5_9FIRM|nr:hypothetical protein [Vallitalea pronyensis]QUI25942.1 hypothetical protein HZI73_26375 [Vallitalea pronyensis]
MGKNKDTNIQFKIDEIGKCIKSFSIDEEMQLCDKCHIRYGCGENHDIHMYDTGICSKCGKLDDVVSCTIAKLVKAHGIDELDYHSLGGKRLAKNEIEVINEIWEKSIKENDEDSQLIMLPDKFRDEEILKAVANGFYGKEMKESLEIVASKPRKYNSALIDEKTIKELDGKVIKIDPKNSGIINPFDIGEYTFDGYTIDDLMKDWRENDRSKTGLLNIETKD